MYQKLADFDEELEVIDCDTATRLMLDYLDAKVCVVLYIEHLLPGIGFKELVPDYC